MSKPWGAVEGQRIAVESVDNQGVVAVGGELVFHEMAVLPDAENVWGVEERHIMFLGRRWSDVVSIPLPGYLNRSAAWGTPMVLQIVSFARTLASVRLFGYSLMLDTNSAAVAG